MHTSSVQAVHTRATFAPRLSDGVKYPVITRKVGK